MNVRNLIEGLTFEETAEACDVAWDNMTDAQKYDFLHAHQSEIEYMLEDLE